MLEARNISIMTEGNMRTIISGLSFTLNPGDKCAVIGEEGNGKSTLLRLLHDESLIEGYASFTGNIYKKGVRTAYLPQELSPEEKKMPVSGYVSDYMKKHMVQTDDVRLRKKILSELDLPENIPDSDRDIGTLSGGERVKLLLMLIRLSDPDVMLLDEPSNDIDIETLETLERYIVSADVPVMFISHDETLLANTANMIIHIEQLRDKTKPRSSVERVDYLTYIENRRRSMDNQNRIAGEERDAYEKKRQRWLKIYNSVEHAQNSVSRQNPGKGRLLKKKMHTVKALGRRFEKERDTLTEYSETEEAILPDFISDISIPGGKKVLELSLSVLKAGDGYNVLSENIHLNVTGPEHVIITGKNGCGKTTLLRKIADSMSGRHDIKAAYMPQNYEDELDLSLNPVDMLAPSGIKDDITEARNFLGAMKFTRDEMTHRIGELSGGQKAKLFLIKFLLGDYNVLILDEPTRNLSPLSGPQVRSLFREFKGAIIAVSHDRMLIREVGDTVYRLESDGLKNVTSDWADKGLA